MNSAEKMKLQESRARLSDSTVKNVLVFGPPENSVFSLPLNSDGRLALSTLSGFFPRTDTLQFRYVLAFAETFQRCARVQVQLRGPGYFDTTRKVMLL